MLLSFKLFYVLSEVSDQCIRRMLAVQCIVINGAYSTQKVGGGYFEANINVGQRLGVYVRSSCTVVI